MSQVSLPLEIQIPSDEELMRAAWRMCSTEIKHKGFLWAINNEPVRRCLVAMTRIQRARLAKLINQQ